MQNNKNQQNCPSNQQACANKPGSKPSSKKSSFKKEELLKGKEELNRVAKNQIHDKSAPNVKQAAEQAKQKKPSQH